MIFRYKYDAAARPTVWQIDDPDATGTLVTPASLTSTLRIEAPPVVNTLERNAGVSREDLLVWDPTSRKNHPRGGPQVSDAQPAHTDGFYNPVATSPYGRQLTLESCSDSSSVQLHQFKRPSLNSDDLDLDI